MSIEKSENSEEEDGDGTVNKIDGVNSTKKNKSGLNPFYSTPDGHPTIVTQSDFARAIQESESSSIDELVELDRYWAVYPYSFISICESTNHGEKRYFVVEPYLSDEENEVLSHLIEKIEAKIRNYDTQILTSDDQHRRAVIREAAIELLSSYNMLHGDVVKKAHEKSGIATEEYEAEDGSKIEEKIQTILLGSEEGIDQSQTSCRRNAFSYGVSGESDYLPIINTVEGHPVIDETDVASGSEPEESDDKELLQEFISTEEDDETVEKGDRSLTDISPEESKIDTDGSKSEVEELWSDGGVINKSADSSTVEGEKTNRVEDLSLPSNVSGELAKSASVNDQSNIHPMTDYQIYKLLYYIEREFVGYKRIDAIKNDDKNVEDMRVSGYHKPVFVYHKNFGQMQTNVLHEKEDLDNFITTLAQFAGEELSRRQPKTEAKLPDGSRAELEKGYETSDTGSNYTIRQFKEVPHTPVDLVNWETYGIDQMAILWLFIQNGKSALIAGGTGAGKTTTLNALSLFIPSQSWIVSIEDTQEIELPHKNWTANTTREAGDLTDEDVEIDEFELLKSALRKRPDNIILGEVRGREAFELLQSIRTGHPGMTTFHAPSFDDVVDRMTSEPIEVPLPLLTAIDVVLIQGETRVGGKRVRRSKNIVEITGYNKDETKTDSSGVLKSKNISMWDAQSDTQQLVAGDSNKFAEVAEENGWSPDRQRKELLERQVILAALIENNINDYTKVSAVLQASMLDTDQVLKYIANGTLNKSVDDFARNLLNIDVDITEGEENVDRPEPSDSVTTRAEQILERARDGGVLSKYD